MNATDILEKLVSFQSVVGMPNGEIASWIRHYLSSFGISTTLLPGPEGDRSNLFASIGPADTPGYILSGHMDVVPASPDEWTSSPFALRRDGEKLYGRGTTDMKGYLACALASVPELIAMELKRPVHLAFSYDEEAGCRGVPHLLTHLPSLCAQPLGAFIGEPSHMRPILAHKGKSAARVTIRGKAGHSSRPDLGLNAIHAMAHVLNAAVSQADRLTQGPFHSAFEPPYSSVSAGVISGGKAVNIIPDLAVLELEGRAIAGMDPAALLAPIRERAVQLEAQGFAVEWQELSAYPALALGKDSALAHLAHDLTGQKPLDAVSYGTEAGLYQAAGIDAIICGPGDIDRAHKPDEFILESELLACQRFIRSLGLHCTQA